VGRSGQNGRQHAQDVTTVPGARSSTDWRSAHGHPIIGTGFIGTTLGRHWLVPDTMSHSFPAPDDEAVEIPTHAS